MYLYPSDAQDLEEYAKIREHLIRERRLSGKSGKELAARTGKGDGFLHGLEKDAGNSKDAVVVVRADGQDGFWGRSHGR